MVSSWEKIDQFGDLGITQVSYIENDISPQIGAFLEVKAMRRPATKCRNSRCRGIVRDGVCSVCGEQKRDWKRYDTKRETANERGYDYSWRRTRLRVIHEEPLCRQCLALGITSLTTDVDHIIPKRRGGTNERSNLQGLCHECHSAKTARGD